MKKTTNNKDELDALLENSKDKKSALKKIVKKLEEDEKPTK